jgi:ubiquinone/menaquinone biosynthesis C-methylase UbiE
VDSHRVPPRVLRPKQYARAFYTKLARWFDVVEGWWERPARHLGLTALDVRPGNRVLEIGPGTGHVLVALAHQVGPSGRVCGLDLAEGMLRVARRRLTEAGLLSRVDIVQGDGACLPFLAGIFDAVFMSFTLELFDTPDVYRVLAECTRVLHQEGRLGVVALSWPERPNAMVRLYEWGHQRLPLFLDCRPLPVTDILRDAGFHELKALEVSLWGLPVAVVVGKAAQSPRSGAPLSRHPFPNNRV